MSYENVLLWLGKILKERNKIIFQVISFTYFLYMYKIKTSIITPSRPKTAPKTATRRTLLPNQAGAALAAIGNEPLFGMCTITGIILDL